MIFLTIGTTEPFDRLVSAMDNIAAALPHVSIMAQISDSYFKIKNMQTVGFIPPAEYYKLFDQASLVISHAGMGTILSALQRKKRIIVMPRRLSLGEANSDHQFGTANKLAALNYVEVANDQDQLYHLISQSLNENRTPETSIGSFASQGLINSLKDFINQKKNLTV